MHPLLSLVVLIASAACLSAQTVSLKSSENGLLVEIDGKLFTEYHVKDVPRPFFYPVVGAAGENIVALCDVDAGERRPYERGLAGARFPQNQREAFGRGQRIAEVAERFALLWRQKQEARVRREIEWRFE